MKKGSSIIGRGLGSITERIRSVAILTTSCANSVPEE